MDSRAPKQASSKTERKKLKLKLNKETLKDLSAADKEIKGGAGNMSHNCCTIDPYDPGTC
jgi:hypothetical protein